VFAQRPAIGGDERVPPATRRPVTMAAANERLTPASVTSRRGYTMSVDARFPDSRFSHCANAGVSPPRFVVRFTCPNVARSRAPVFFIAFRAAAYIERIFGANKKKSPRNNMRCACTQKTKNTLLYSDSLYFVLNSKVMCLFCV